MGNETPAEVHDRFEEEHGFDPGPTVLNASGWPVPIPHDNPGPERGRGYVLVVRHPDAANEFTVEGDVMVIDIDLGSSFDGTVSGDEAVEWVEGELGRLDSVPVGPVLSAAISVISEAVVDSGEADDLIDAYVAKRDGGAEGRHATARR